MGDSRLVLWIASYFIRTQISFRKPQHVNSSRLSEATAKNMKNRWIPKKMGKSIGHYRRASEGCPVSQSRWLLRIEYLDLCSTTARSNHPKSEAREIIFKTTNSFCMSSSAARPSRVHTWNLSKFESRFGIQKQQEKLKSKYLEK